VRVSEIRRALAEYLEDSPTAQRMAFYLREIEGLARREICRILDNSSRGSRTRPRTWDAQRCAACGEVPSGVGWAPLDVASPAAGRRVS